MRLWENITRQLRTGRKILVLAAVFMVLITAIPCFAYYLPLNSSSSGNIGVGTASPQTRFSIVGGNVGIGTWTAANASLETTGIRLIGNGAAAGSVLVSSSTGIGTWMAASTLATSGSTPSGWSTGTATVYNTTGSDNVGIGTTTPQGGLVVTNGNVGVGTWTTIGGRLIVSGPGNVGINTAWPGAKFEVVGPGTTTNMARFINSQGSMTFYLAPTIPASGVWTTSGGAFYETQIGVSSDTDLWLVQNNTAKIKMPYTDSVQITDSTGLYVQKNVGIGTTTYQAALAVMGNVGIGTWAPITSLDTKGFRLATGPSAGYVLVSGSTGIGTWMAASTLATSGSTPSGWSTGTGTVYTTTGSDNVGIGTITVPEKLTISGNIQFTAGASRTINVATNPGGSGNDLTVSAGNPSAASDNYGGNLYLKGGDSDGGGAMDAGNVYISGGSDALSSLQGDVILGNNGSTTLGNVGIGTWAPTAALQVNSTNASPFIVDANGNVGIGTTRTSSARFVVMGQNVGLGTWLPATPVHLKTTYYPTLATFESGCSGCNTNIEVQNIYKGNNDSTSVKFKFYGGGAAYIGGVSPSSLAAELSFSVMDASGATVTAARIDKNGNLGVGTTTPQAKLVVLDGNVGIGTWTAGGGKLIVMGSGNVGISTAWPGTALDVNGTIRSVGTGNSYFAGNVGVGTSAAPNTLAVQGTLAVGSAAFAGATLPANSLVVSGNIGVGSTAPGTPLDVNGRARLVGIGTTVPCALCMKADGTLGYYNTTTFQGICN